MSSRCVSISPNEGERHAIPHEIELETRYLTGYTERMEERVYVSWQAKEYDFQPKERPWYWAVGIIAGAVAIAAFILGDYLFSLIAILGGFTVMLLGSKKPRRHTYRLTERGFKIGERLIPYKSMVRFAIREDEPRELVIESTTLLGTFVVPLGDTDHRAIVMELKNNNVEEVESLGTFVDRVASGMGL